jgi:hypothetical protein
MFSHDTAAILLQLTMAISYELCILYLVAFLCIVRFAEVI